jgi:hypothetical protein
MTNETATAETPATEATNGTLTLVGGSATKVYKVDLSDLGLNKKDAEFVTDKTIVIEQAMENVTTSAMKIGEALTDVKMRLPAGTFTKWLETSFGMTDRTAQRYMSVAKTFHGREINPNISNRALYMLASDNVPQDARDEALRLADEGNRITTEKAETIIEQSKRRATAKRTGGADAPEPAPEEVPDTRVGSPTTSPTISPATSPEEEETDGANDKGSAADVYLDATGGKVPKKYRGLFELLEKHAPKLKRNLVAAINQWEYFEEELTAYQEKTGEKVLTDAEAKLLFEAFGPGKKAIGAVAELVETLVPFAYDKAAAKDPNGRVWLHREQYKQRQKDAEAAKKSGVKPEKTAKAEG